MRTPLPALAVFAALAALAALSGCGGTKSVLARPAAGAYRIPGLAPNPMPLSPEEGTHAYRVEVGSGVVYEVQASVVRDEVRVVTVVQNVRGETIRYDLRRAALTALEGKKLELVAVSDDASRRPSAGDRASEDYLRGLRLVLRGERTVVTRRYRLPSLIAAVQASRLLAALELDDELGGVDGALPVKLRFEKVR
ncbi:MAG TPA: hypothetical protein VEB43_21750 [Anaeromyxobacter sp.]|nr:hypothetical protein [Anaeromyxobacter sp.]